MKNLGELTALVVPTGNSLRQDLERLAAAEKMHLVYGSPYIVSGVGPDINEARFDSKDYIVDAGDLDVHADLYNALVRRFYQAANQGKYKPFGVDIRSVNSRENLTNTFPLGQEGTYKIFSYPLHILKFKVQERQLKSRGFMSKDVKIEYAPTKSWTQQTREEWMRGAISLVKALVS